MPASTHLRWPIGTVLVTAALLTASGGSGATLGRLELDEAFGLLLILVELALAACCFSGIAPAATQRALVALFSGFLLFAMYLALSGADSCGCFGPVKVHPWWTAGLDAMVLGLLVLWKPQRQGYGGEERHLLRVEGRGLAGGDIPHARAAGDRRCAMFLAIYAATALPAVTWWLAADRPTALAGGASLDDVGGLVILEPETWQGEALPIAAEIDVGDLLAAGEWTLLLYHHDCPQCQEAVPRYVELAQRLERERRGARVALVETPPYAAGEVAVEGAAACIVGRLSDRREWFVRTPVEISLKNGNVVGVRREL